MCFLSTAVLLFGTASLCVCVYAAWRRPVCGLYMIKLLSNAKQNDWGRGRGEGKFLQSVLVLWVFSGSPAVAADADDAGDDWALEAAARATRSGMGLSGLVTTLAVCRQAPATSTRFL